MDESMQLPVVAIWMITYNHQPYIEQAIEGIVTQVTDFPICLYIGEDCSTDNTRAICIRLKEKYPERIHLLLNEKNDIKRNCANVYRACFTSGARYIAYCEGDDYWTDPDKLQKQVDFLDANSDYSFCFHAVYEESGNERRLVQISGKDETYTLNDLSKQNFIATNSVVFRNNSFGKLPDWFQDSYIGDYVVHLLNAKTGKIKYFSQAMGVYRRHSGGIYGGKAYEFQCKALLILFDNLVGEFSDYPDIKDNLAYQRAFYAAELANIYNANGDVAAYLKYIKESLKSSDAYFDEWLTSKDQQYNSLTQSREQRVGHAVLKPLRKLKRILKK